MNQIKAEVLARSINPQGDELITYLLVYPRFIHSELMTHRMFSRNSASSRAIPFEKMVKMVEEDPFIPIAWQKSHKGMQGNEYFTDSENIKGCVNEWLKARDYAVQQATVLNEDLGYGGVTKQLCNRLLEPFMWHTVLVTATEWENFFELRCPKYWVGNPTMYPKRSWKDLVKEMQEQGFDSKPSITTYGVLDKLKFDQSQAEIHIQALAEAMWDARNESTPKQLKAGEWHIPDFGLHKGLLEKYISDYFLSSPKTEIKIAVAHCAKLSYNNHGNSVDFAKDIKLHNQLLASHHMSPFEHVARVMSDEEYDSFFKGRTYVNQNEPNSKELNNFYKENGHGWCNNFRGFIPYRYLIENEKI